MRLACPAPRHRHHGTGSLGTPCRQRPGAHSLCFCLISFRAPASRDAPPSLVPILAIAAVILGDVALLAAGALPVSVDRAAMPAGLTSPIEMPVVTEQFAWNIHYPGPDRRFGTTRVALISAPNPLGIDRATADAADDVGVINVLMLPLNRTVIAI